MLWIMPEFTQCFISSRSRIFYLNCQSLWLQYDLKNGHKCHNIHQIVSSFDNDSHFGLQRGFVMTDFLLICVRFRWTIRQQIVWESIKMKRKTFSFKSHINKIKLTISQTLHNTRRIFLMSATFNRYTDLF